MVTYPSDWKQSDIGNITDAIITGGTPSTSNPAYWNGKIPWLASAEIHQKRVKRPTQYITSIGIQNSSAKMAPEGSVLIALAGQGKTRGTAAILMTDMAINQSIAALVANSDTNKDFLYYKMASEYLELRKVSSGDGGRGGLNKKLLKSFSLCIPSDKDEQESIAKILSEIDVYISDLEVLIEKKRNIREGAIEDLVSGRTRLPGFNKAWKSYSFDNYFSLLSNNTFSRDKLSNRGSIGNIHYGDVLIKYYCIVNSSDIIPRIKDDVPYEPKHYLQKNDVVIADTAEDDAVGRTVQIGDVTCPLVAGLHTIPCRPLIDTADGYLGYYMNSRAYHDQLYQYITGIKVSSVSKTSFKKTELYLPTDIEEQKAIVKVLSSMDSEIRSLQIEQEKMSQIREGAMDDLLTGRVRVKA